LQARLSLDKLRMNVAARLRAEIDGANLQKYASKEGDPDRSWYWVAPLLLDKAKSEWQAPLEAWLNGNPDSDEPWGRSTYFRGASENAPVKERHFEQLRVYYERPDKSEMGPLPPDLAEVLADLALGSPAILMLRSLRRVFPEQDTAKAMVEAFDVADEF